MPEQIAPDFAKLTNELRFRINQVLQDISAPQIGLGKNNYERAKSFVDFNQWLKSANRESIHQLTMDYGLLPMVFSLSGLDLTAVALLQQDMHIDFLGHVRYISMTLGSVTGTNTQDILDVSQTFFASEFKNTSSQSAETRSRFISSIIEYLVNTDDHITYDKALEHFLDLLFK